MTEQTLSRPAGPQALAPAPATAPERRDRRARSSTSRPRSSAAMRRLHRYLGAELPFSWRIVIADNASTDATPAIAQALAHELPGVELLRIDRKGRGRALREAWSRSDAPGPLLHGRRPVDGPARACCRWSRRCSRGTATSPSARRLARSARVVRGPKRELISRGYNRLLHTVAARALLRRAVRLQGRDRDGGPARCSTTSATTAGSSTPSCSCSPSAAACASTRSRSTGSTTPTRAWTSCAPRSRTCAASRAWRSPGPVVRFMGVGVAEHDRLRRCSTSCCTARSARAARTPSRWRSPRWPTPPPTAA